MLESAFQAQCVSALKRMGWFARIISRPDRRTRTKKGVPDIYAHKKGRVLWIECKSEKGKLKPEQEQFQRDCEEHGIEYGIVRNIHDLLKTVSVEWGRGKV